MAKSLGNDRLSRKRRGGMSPVAAGALLLVAAVLVTYFGFAQQLPFTHGYRLNAVFENAVNVRPGSPVRIAGVNVGEVSSVSRYKQTDAAVVQMEIDDAGLPIHRDATIKIRPRIFFEGSYFMDLSPGSPSAPTLEDDDAPLPVTQTAAPVQFDQVLTSLQADVRRSLQVAVDQLGSALTYNPTDPRFRGTPQQIAAFNDGQDPDVQDESAAQAFQDQFSYSPAALRDAAIVNQALLGLAPDDLPELIAGLQEVAAALDRNEGDLKGLIAGFNTTMGALADESTSLSASVRLLGPTLLAADRSFDALEEAFPPTRAFAQEILPGVEQTAATIDAAFPWIAQTRELVGPDELGGLVDVLQPTVAQSANLIDQTLTLLPQTDLVARCALGNVLPATSAVLQDGNFTSGLANYREFFQSLVGLAGEGQNFDGNGMYVRFQPGGGQFAVSSGATTFGSTPLFANALERPLGTRPAYPGRHPPYRSDVPCYRSTPPNLVARTGPGERVVGIDNSLLPTPAVPLPIAASEEARDAESPSAEERR